MKAHSQPLLKHICISFVLHQLFLLQILYNEHAEADKESEQLSLNYRANS